MKQLFPPLDAATEAALRASIERFGVIYPVVEDQHENVLDGHHRKRIAEELGKPYEIQTVSARDEDEAREITRTLNADRRHLSVEERREVVAALRQDGHSERAIAGALGVAKTTVHRDVAQLVQADQLTPPTTITGLDGRSRRAERKRAAVAQAQARITRTLERIDAEATEPNAAQTPFAAARTAEGVAERAMAEEPGELAHAADVVAAEREELAAELAPSKAWFGRKYQEGIRGEVEGCLEVIDDLAGWVEASEPRLTDGYCTLILGRLDELRKTVRATHKRVRQREEETTRPRQRKRHIVHPDGTVEPVS